MELKMDKKLAVVTGANKGIGYEVSKQLAKKGFKVILTSRDVEKGKAAAKILQDDGLDIFPYQLDVTNQESINKLKEFVQVYFGKLDVLINNAGVFLDPSGKEDNSASVFNADIETLRKTVETNTFGPFLMCQAFIPLMQNNNYGRVVNISTGMGQLAEMDAGWPAYRISKTALNAVTKVFASELKGSNVLVNSVCPGWVRTDMGGPNAPKSVEQAAETIIWLATLPFNGPSGGFFRERRSLLW